MLPALKSLDDRSFEAGGLRKIIDRSHRTAKDKVEYVVIVVTPERQRRESSLESHEV